MKKVLVVDNDRVTLRLVSKLLDKQGYQVKTADDGLAALDVLKSYSPDIMFIDLVMPNIDGIMLCRSIRSKAKFKNTHLIILSAISAEEWVDISKLGANACIAKGPFDKMSKHILAAIERPEETASRCLAGEVLGLKHVYPRGITTELLRVKKHFEVILEKMSEGVLEVNSKGRIVFVNSAALALTGKPENGLLGRHFVDLFSEVDRSRLFHLFESDVDKPKTIGEDMPLMLDNLLITMNILPFEGPEANALVILSDITEQKQAEDNIKAARDYAQNIIAGSLDMIVSVNMDRKIVEFNRAAEKVFGYRKEEISGQDVGILYANQEEGKKVSERVRQNGQYVGQIINKRKDGSTFTTLLSCGSMLNKDGESIGIVGVSRDITDKLQSEITLRESEEKYRNILESIEEGYYEVDLLGNFTFVNQALCANTGYSKKELLGMNNRDYSSPETSEYMYEVFHNVYQTGKPAKISDYEVICKDGTKRCYELSTSLITDRNGNKTGFRGLSRDITERKEAETKRMKLEAQLQQAQKMEAIGTLAGGIAHDFNNLLMGIQGQTSLLLVDPDMSDQCIEHLNAIEEYIQRAADLNKHLLGLARSGKYEVKATNINELIKKSAHMFGRTKKEIKIHSNFQENIWSVEVDRGQIEQVLLNIFVNAGQAMPKGGQLHIKTENYVIDESNRTLEQMVSGKYVLISITDTGVGMDEETQLRIFDPFFTTKELKRGTGLGLASAYGIIKNHEGFIDVSSGVDKGSTFYIYLPASSKEAIKVEPGQEEIKKGKETILLIDDENMVLDVTRSILEKLNYDVWVAKSGKEAIDIYKSNQDRIDIVILDMIMPEMDGGSTFDHLKAINPEIKVLLSSGYSIDGKATEIMARGCKGFIQKPFSMSKISLKIREILDPE